jgi:hypothetical protein
MKLVLVCSAKAGAHRCSSWRARGSRRCEPCRAACSTTRAARAVRCSETARTNGRRAAPSGRLVARRLSHGDKLNSTASPTSAGRPSGSPLAPLNDAIVVRLNFLRGSFKSTCDCWMCTSSPESLNSRPSECREFARTIECGLRRQCSTFAYELERCHRRRRRLLTNMPSCSRW